MHEELVNNESNNSNGLIHINIDKKSTFLSDIFYFQKIVKKQCDKCKIDIWNEPYIMKNILFDYQSLVNFNNQKDQKDSLDIYDCFDYFVQINNNNEKCKNCANPIKTLCRIKPTGEIITIILDRGGDLNNNIPFNLKINEQMKFYKYLDDNSRDKYTFKLIAFSSFYSDKKKYYSFYRNEDKNDSWYYYDGTNSHEFGSQEYGIPVLLFYKKFKI